MPEMTALDMLFTRCSVRSYTEEPVSEKDMETILRAGMFAPSAHNGRTWELITITDRNKLNELASLCKYWQMLREAPLAIAVCSDAKGNERAETFLEQNGAASAENMLLAAHAIGLGGVWLNSSPEREHYIPSKKALGIPEAVRLVALLAIGHPAAEQPPRRMPDRYEPEKWHREQW